MIKHLLRRKLKKLMQPMIFYLTLIKKENMTNLLLLIQQLLILHQTIQVIHIVNLIIKKNIQVKETLKLKVQNILMKIIKKLITLRELMILIDDILITTVQRPQTQIILVIIQTHLLFQKNLLFN